MEFKEELKLQQVESSYSKVNKLNYNYKPLNDIQKEEVQQLSHNLLKCKYLLEWAYGYRADYHGHKRTKRRSPSAGALYPIEILVLLNENNETNLYYYDFDNHHFYKITNPQLAEEVSINNIIPNSFRIILCSVYWRTVQKYGVRGYRYCILDASFIFKNILRVYNLSQQVNPCQLIFGNDQKINLEFLSKLSVRPIFSLELDCNFDMPNEPNFIKPIELNNEHIDYINYSPDVSTRLIRLYRFYDKALRNTFQKMEFPILHETKTSSQIYTYIENRYSTHQYEPKVMTNLLYELLFNRLIVKCNYLESTFNFNVKVAAWISNVEGINSPNIKLISSSKELTNIINEIELKDNNELFEACQKQAVVLSSSLTLLFLIDTNHLLNSDWRFVYSKEIFAAGMISDEVYEICNDLGLSTTIIGNVSESKFNQLFKSDKFMIISAQTCGYEGQRVDKVDSVKFFEM